ncbi:MAG: hypothetical protein JJU45_00290 [Acidimicrobiia bacterium]|nr:hypothetical protein [Acidimicrobiia bacterium]
MDTHAGTAATDPPTDVAAPTAARRTAPDPRRRRQRRLVWVPLAFVAVVLFLAACERLQDAQGVAAGGDHTCVLTSEGAVICSGAGESGQLGDGSTVDANRPVEVIEAGAGPLTDATAVAAGATHSCAVRGGTVSCWGAGSLGQIGDGSFTQRTRATPASALGLVDATTITAGANHTCVLLADATVSCWGDDAAGQTGSGTPGGTTAQPTPVAGLAGVTAVAAGANHTCALLADATVSCWGDDAAGQTGSGTPGGTTEQPAVVAGLSGVVAIAAGANHTCALLDTAAVSCWGDNAAGQTGTGSPGGVTAEPTVVGGLSSAAALAAGANHTCATQADGQARCWGDDTRGQLGVGVTEPQNQASPRIVPDSSL